MIVLRLKSFDSNKTAIICDGKSFSYGNMIKLMEMFQRERWRPGAIKPIVGVSSVMGIAKMFAAIDANQIIVPMVDVRKPELWQVKSHLYETIRKRHVPGLVLFTSGSSGEPKVAVHDLSLILAKWKVYNPEGWKPADAKITLGFLGFDHIGGLNTIFHSLLNGGTLVLSRSVDASEIGKIIDHYKVEVLPTTPTFLKMLMIKTESKFKSLILITYGTEPMPQSTLSSLKERYPHIKLKQTYGLTEVGIMASKSREDGSTWMKLGGDGFDYRIVDNCLEIKSRSALLGYLNAPTPFTHDGYYITGDRVEQDGEWLRIVGRKSEFINVGGEKFHPSEIESEIMKLDEIDDCLVEGEENPIIGQIIKCTVKLNSNIDLSLSQVKSLITSFLSKEGFSRYKIPQRIVLTEKDLHNSRHKKVRICSRLKD